MLFQVRLKGVLSCFKEVSISLKGVSRKFQEYFKKVSKVLQERLFQGSFKRVIRNIEGCSNGVLNGVQECL